MGVPQITPPDESTVRAPAPEHAAMESLRPDSPSESPPAKVEVPVPCALMTPPESVSPLADASPSDPTESPPENVEVAFP